MMIVSELKSCKVAEVGMRFKVVRMMECREQLSCASLLKYLAHFVSYMRNV
jgi:hypothetical protein